MKHRKTIRNALIFFLIVATVNCRRIAAQSGTSSAISGTVTDATGAALPNAEVEATEINTAAVRTERSNADGRFLFSQVNPGTYTVTVRADGFQKQTSQPVAVEVGRTVTLNMTLSLVHHDTDRRSHRPADRCSPWRIPTPPPPSNRRPSPTCPTPARTSPSSPSLLPER